MDRWSPSKGDRKKRRSGEHLSEDLFERNLQSACWPLLVIPKVRSFGTTAEFTSGGASMKTDCGLLGKDK